MKYQYVNVRPATPSDASLPSFDNTKLTAINTCPTWGILRYEQHKAMPASGRAMALEAGSAMHEVFAAVRLIELGIYQKHTSLMMYHGPRLFGEARWESMMNQLNDTANTEETRQLNFCLDALYTSGFHDDPNDKRRTLRTLEEAAIAYFNKYQFNKYPVWVREPHVDASDVGIEVPFDIVIEFGLSDETKRTYRFVGRIDGVHTDDKGMIVVQENKTASRLGDAWAQSFYMSHQVTGYMLAMALWTQSIVEQGIIRGVSIPLPKTYDYGGVVALNVSREPFMIEHWFNWFFHTTQIWEQYKDNVIDAPRYTHSCNRYFRPCAFIPFCAVPDEEKEQVLSEMEHRPWSPLAEREDTE